MDEKGVYSEHGDDHGTPTTEGSGPGGGGTLTGSDAGGNKRDPVETSPTIGHTIGGRSLDGEGATQPGLGEGEEEHGGGIFVNATQEPDQGHLNQE